MIIQLRYHRDDGRNDIRENYVTTSLTTTNNLRLSLMVKALANFGEDIECEVNLNCGIDVSNEADIYSNDGLDY